MTLWQLFRDPLIVTTSLIMLVVEIGWLGGRAQVITGLVGLLLSPMAMRFDRERRRTGNDE